MKLPPILFSGLPIEVSYLLGKDRFVQKIKTWKHRSLKRPSTTKVYTYNRPVHAFAIEKRLFISPQLLEFLQNKTKENK